MSEPTNINDLISESIPKDEEEISKVLINLTNELMEKTARLNAVEQELKEAVKRKKVKYDPRLKTVAMVMFTKPKGDSGKVRMHTVDNVHGNLALTTIKRMMNDKDNHFLGVHLLLPMQGRPDAYQRLSSNAEAVWYLFERLDQDLKKLDPERKEEEPEQE
jgi:hypothetical protein